MYSQCFAGAGDPPSTCGGTDDAIDCRHRSSNRRARAMHRRRVRQHALVRNGATSCGLGNDVAANAHGTCSGSLRRFESVQCSCDTFEAR